jgi:WD40 repeat protein/serine/threonine protein kinase
MASEAGEPLPEGERRKELHVSFVQRLRRHFGADLDPQVDLQDEEERARRAGEPGTPTPTGVEDFVRRLGPSMDVGSRYVIKQDIASGGMGTILRVWDGDLRRNLAMKVMHSKGGASSSEASAAEPLDPERLGRFLEEAQITGQLDHPGVVPVHELGIDSRGRCYFTMRFVRGRELKEVLDLARDARDGWTRTKVLGVILKVCEAMAYAHSKGVVHRDLKPANVMVGRFGETYVMDWGLARVLGRRDSHDLRLRPRPEDASALSLVRTVRREETELNPESPLVTMDGDVIGTPSYMAPEQARGKLEEVGPRSDVYSLGAILYYMLTGQVPYVKPGERVSPHTVLSRVLDGPPTPLERLAPHEPAELIAICAKAMARDPAVRYGSMLEVADDIQAYLENRVVRAYERGSLAEFKKWVVRNKGMAAGIAGMLALLLSGAVLFAWQQREEYEQLSRKEAETAQAKDQAVQSLARAQLSEQRARENLELANQGRLEADKQTLLARRNEERALRSGYAANILAADYSFKLNDLAEARARLRMAEERLRGWEWQHLGQMTSAPLANLGKFTGVEGLAFHPQEERVIVLTGQGHLKVRDLATLRDVPPENITATEQLVNTLLQLFSNLAFDVDGAGTRIALVGAGQGLQVFDLESGQRPPGVPSSGLEGHAAKTSAVAFSPNGRTLASGDDEGMILVRDALNWEILQRLPGHIAQITALAWSPGSERLASSSRDGSVRLWELEGARDSTTPLKGHRGAVRAVVWDLLGEQVFSAGEDGAIHQWEVASGRLLRSFLGHEGAVYALDFDPNHARLVTGSADRTVRVWDVATATSVVLRGHEAPVKEVAFDPQGERVLSGDQTGIVYLWDAEGDLTTTEMRMHRDAVTALAFDPSGERLVSASEDHELVLWDATSGEPLRRLRDHTGIVNSVVFGADGRALLSGSHDKTATLWDAETGTKQRLYGPFNAWVETAVLTPDGSRVIVATGDKKVLVLDARTTGVLRELTGYQYPFEDLVLSPDGERIATVGRDLFVWDLTGDLRAPVFTHRGRHVTAAFTADGRRLATGSVTGLVQLWDALTGEWQVDRQDQAKKLNALAFSPDDRRLVSASEDGQIHVRDAQSGETLLVLREPRGAVRALAFSPDGARLATGVEDGSLRIYETTPSSVRRALRREASELRERARELVEELFARHFRLEEVLRALNADASMPHALREAALREADLRGDDPLPLLQRSLAECLDADQTDETYDLALKRAAAAEDMKPNVSGMPRWELDGLGNLVLGIAAYRVARFDEAERRLATETRPSGAGGTESRGLFGRREQALRLLFLCMAQCQTAQLAEAERSLRLAQQSVLDDVELSQRAELLGLLAEVESLMRSSSSPKGS